MADLNIYYMKKKPKKPFSITKIHSQITWIFERTKICKNEHKPKKKTKIIRSNMPLILWIIYITVYYKHDKFIHSHSSTHILNVYIVTNLNVVAIDAFAI